MSERDLPVDSCGEVHTVAAYMCAESECNRCYNGAAGYFDFIAGRPHLDAKQKLCKTDAHAMYLECIRYDGEELWRCPQCDAGVTV